MAIVCRDYGLLFIMTPRTACTAVGAALCDRLGGKYLPAADLHDANGMIAVQRKHSTLSELIDHQLLDADEARGLVTFTTVRNPFDSLLSYYVKLSQTYVPLLDDPDSWVHRIPRYADHIRFCVAHSFDEWIEDRYGVSQLARLRGRGRQSLHDRFARDVDHVLRFEHLQHDFQGLMSRIGVDHPVEISIVNRTPQRSGDYRAHYSASTRRTVEYVFASDLARYGYSF